MHNATKEKVKTCHEIPCLHSGGSPVSLFSLHVFSAFILSQSENCSSHGKPTCLVSVGKSEQDDIRPIQQPSMTSKGTKKQTNKLPGPALFSRVQYATSHSQKLALPISYPNKRPSQLFHIHFHKVNITNITLILTIITDTVEKIKFLFMGRIPILINHQDTTNTSHRH